jgi:hypothetical protein
MMPKVHPTIDAILEGLRQAGYEMNIARASVGFEVSIRYRSQDQFDHLANIAGTLAVADGITFDTAYDAENVIWSLDWSMCIHGKPYYPDPEEK